MNTTILKDRKVTLEDIKYVLKELAKVIKQDGTELSLTFLIQLKALTLQFLLSYKEYSLRNIREYGLGEILWMRALRFFKLDLRNPEEEKKLTQRIRKTKRGIRKILKTIGKTILFPFYVILLIIEWMYKKRKRPKHKVNKFVKNSYHD